MEPKGSLPRSKQPATCHYPEYLVYVFPSYFFKVQFITVLPSTLGSSKWSLSYKFPHQNLVCISLPHICVTCPTNFKNTAVMALAIYCLSLYWHISSFVWNSPLAGLNALISKWRIFLTQLLLTVLHLDTGVFWLLLSSHLQVDHVGYTKQFGIYMPATRCGLDGPGIKSRWGEIFHTRPDRTWGLPSLLYNGYRVFPGGKAAGARCWPPTHYLSAKVMKE